jgi:hypothetical protein
MFLAANYGYVSLKEEDFVELVLLIGFSGLGTFYVVLSTVSFVRILKPKAAPQNETFVFQDGIVPTNAISIRQKFGED